MPLVDFVISNPGHHVAMMQPVISVLKQRGNMQCRVISLCPFRGFSSPTDNFSMADAFISVPDRQFRSSPAAGKQGGWQSRRLRGIAREFSWWTVLQRPLRHIFAAQPDLVVLPNDAAFPYDHIVRLLHGRGIPFMLMQEGIRFPLPTDKEHDAYGSGGAAAIAAWGETSAAYFRAQGAPSAAIHCTGSPRFDQLLNTDWRPQAEQLVAQYNFGQTNLLFLSNPIDDQGFCTTDEKMMLVRRFLAETAPLFSDPGFHLIMKLHPRESVVAFQAEADACPFHSQITVLGQAPLYPLFTLAHAAVVLASTVGLEAMLFDVPLGVLEIPGTGFVYDYVSSGAALGLHWQQPEAASGSPLASQLQTLLSGQGLQDTAVSDVYIQQNLAVRRDAAGQVATLIEYLTR